MAPQKGSQHERETPRRLLDCWQAWSNEVARIVNAPDRAKISDEQYENLNTAVLAAIEDRRREARGSELETLKQLEALAAPWLTLKVLSQAQREIQQDLVRRCQDIERLLGGPGPVRKLRGWHKYGIVFALTITALVLLVALRPSAAVAAPASFVRILHQIGLKLENASGTAKLMAFVLLMLMVGGWFMRKIRAS